MLMEEEGEEASTFSSPFWLQSTTHHRRRPTISSFFLNSGLLIFFLCLTAVAFVFFVIPLVVSFTSQFFRPNLVKKSWDSVNIVLVVFALAFGFLIRNRNQDSSFDENHRKVSDGRTEIQKSNPSTPRQWYESSDRTVDSSFGIGGGLRRNSSYPDLRVESSWVNGDVRRRFSDDIQVEAHRYSQYDRFMRRRSWKRVDEEEDSKIIDVDTFVTRAKEDSYTSSPQPTVSAPAKSPPVTVVHRKSKRRHETIVRTEQAQGSEPTETLTPPAMTMTPSSSPAPPDLWIDSEKKSSKGDRKRSGATATKDLFTSIYNQKNKKKKQRQKSVDHFETLLQSQAPPPPPPPPPPSVLHNLFSSKKGKSKKIITLPPPITTAVASKTTALIVPIASRQQPLPMKTSNFQSTEQNSNSAGESPLTGSDSPLIPIPPPPPPPPFKMPSWRFVVKGDYVKVGSMNSSRSGSPDDSPRSESSIETGGNGTAVDGGESVAPLFCPSPDVDTKADMFIAKFRAGLKLQKMNSMIRQKQGLGLSNLGPETKP